MTKIWSGILVVLVTGSAAFGGWRNIGPTNFGGKVYAVAVDRHFPSDAYAAYEVGGLWGTHNAGRRWKPMFDGLTNMSFSSVQTHPTVGGMVAAGLIANGGGYSRSYNQDVGIRLSTDRGRHWRNIGPDDVDGAAGASVWEIGFGDATGQTIYAPTDKGLFKTTDQGLHWNKVLDYSGPSFFDDRPSFAVDPANPSIVLLAVRSLGVMRSVDAGSSWQRVDNWVNPGTAFQNPTLLAWSGADPSYVYAESETNGNNAVLALHVSHDAGLTWTTGATTSAFNQGMYDMAIAADPFDRNHVVIHNSSLEVSTDGGATLSAGTLGRPDCLGIAFDPSTPGVIYDGGDEGAFASRDGGQTWTRFDTGVSTNKSSGGSSYAVATDGRIWLNPVDYGGVTFFPKKPGTVVPGYEYSRFFVNPHDPNDAYLFFVYGDGLFRVTIAGQISADLDPEPSSNSDNTALDFDPVDPNTLYVGKQLLHRSVDRGSSWTTIPINGSNPPVKLVRVAPSNAQHLYVVTDNVLWRSTDGGASWANGAWNVGSVHAMAVSPADDDTLYVAAGSGLYRSTDGGATLAQLDTSLGVSFQLVAVSPTNPTTVYAALSAPMAGGTVVRVSSDGGATWSTFGSLPLVQPEWMQLHAHKLYLGTDAGVWRIAAR